MRFIHLTTLLALAVFASGEVPSNSYLPGRFLFLPARQQTQEAFLNPLSGYRPSETTTASSTTSTSTTEAAKPESDEKEDTSESTGNEQSQQVKNVDSGLYYVLLPDGRLQRVEYRTAPLIKEDSAKLIQLDLKTTETQSKSAINGTAVSEKHDGSSSEEGEEVVNADRKEQGQYTEGSYAQFPFQYEIAQDLQTSPVESNYQHTSSQGGSFSSAAEFQRQQTYQQYTVNQGAHYIQTAPDQQQAEINKQAFSGVQHQVQQPQQVFSREQEQPQQVVTPYQTSYNVNGVQYQIIQNQPAHYVQIQPEQSSQQNVFPQVTYDFQQSEQQAQYPVLQSDNKPTEEDGSEEKQQTETPMISFNGFTATVQYTDVEPISAPIYAYNAMPLVRILKK